VDAHEPVLRATYWVSNAFDLPPELSQAMQNYYALPVVGAFPLQCYRFSQTEGNDYRLKTTWLEHIAADSHARFEPPANYRQAKSEEQILFGQEKTDLIKTMTND